MDALDSELIELLQFLLPGFVAAWVFHALSSYPKSSQFERIVQALILTILVQGIVYLAKYALFGIGNFWSIGVWAEGSDVIASLACAFGLGFTLVYFSNNDKFHSFLRKLGITRETSYASEWFGAFSSNVTYVVLHLKGERRLFGWPIEWPTESGKGHFLITDASWLDDQNKQTELTGVQSILIPGSSVRMVEFMDLIKEKSNDKESVQSAP